MKNHEREYEIAKKVRKRYDKWLLKNTFTWTSENVERIKALNEVIMQKENSLYDIFANMKKDIERLLAEGKSYYEAYDMDGTLSYEADDYSTPIADDKTMFEVYCCTNFDLCCSIRTNKDRTLKSKEIEFFRDSNWNYDKFHNFPDIDYKISRFLHLLAEEETYTMEDLLYLNPECFVECIEIRN